MAKKRRTPRTRPIVHDNADDDSSFYSEAYRRAIELAGGYENADDTFDREFDRWWTKTEYQIAMRRAKMELHDRNMDRDGPNDERLDDNVLTASQIRSLERTLAETHQAILRPADADSGVVQAVISLNTELIDHLKRNPGDLHRISPRQFEELVAEILAAFGWRVNLTRSTKDGGYDIFGISRDASGLESPWLVECKKYNPARPVGVEIVRSFWAVKTPSPFRMD